MSIGPFEPHDRPGSMKHTRFPQGWDEDRVRRVLEHYDAQSDEEAVAEDEAAYESTSPTAMEIPRGSRPANSRTSRQAACRVSEITASAG